MNAPKSNLLRHRQPTPHNGYLVHVPGQDIAAGSQTLPPPSAEENSKPERIVEIDSVELGGRVRITYRLRKHRHHKTTRWSWVAYWAEPIYADGQPLSAP